MDRSVEWFVDQVRRGVHGPEVSVVGSPLSKIHVPSNTCHGVPYNHEARNEGLNGVVAFTVIG